MTELSVSEQGRTPPSQIVAGYLAALSIAASVASLAWHPLRLIAPAIVLSLVSAGMAGRTKRLPMVAVFVAAACFFLGMMITVITSRPLW